MEDQKMEKINPETQQTEDGLKIYEPAEYGHESRSV